jgi:hypothetical protein
MTTKWRNEVRTCACGNRFTPSRAAQTHCSPRCRDAAKKRRKRIFGPPGGSQRLDVKPLLNRKAAARRTVILADLCAPSLRAEEATPLASCSDLTR